MSSVFLKTLEELGDDEFEKFKWFLQNRVEWSRLEKADRPETVNKIIESYEQQSAEAVKKILEKIHRNDLVTKLSRTTTGEQETDEAPLTSPLVKASKAALKTSSKFDHITSKVLLHSGSPAVYQLKPKRENIGTLTKMTLGEKNPNKTILLVGETGTGKSTLINALVNYAMGVEWKDDVWFEIVEDKKRSQSESQTSDVIVYQIFGFGDQTLPYSLTIIDTPGYRNTKGIEYDDIVSERLLDWFRSDDGVHEIDVVGLVLEALENRLSDRLCYIFNSVMSLFGKDMEEKIVALITHSDGRKPKNALRALEAANIKCAKDVKNQPVYFLFNNCQNEDRTEDPEDLEYADKITTKGMKEFTDFLEKTAPQKLKITVDVLNERVRLKACIQNLQERVEFIESKKREIHQTQEASKKEKYDKTKADCERTTSLLENLKKKMEKLQREQDQWLVESFQHVVKLEQIALNADSASTYIYLDFLIEKMKERGDKEKVQKLEEMKSRVEKDNATMAALWYRFGRITAASKAAGQAVKGIIKPHSDQTSE